MKLGGGAKPLVMNSGLSGNKPKIEEEDDNPIMGPGAQVKIGGGLGGPKPMIGNQ